MLVWIPASQCLQRLLPPRIRGCFLVICPLLLAGLPIPELFLNLEILALLPLLVADVGHLARAAHAVDRLVRGHALSQPIIQGCRVQEAG